MPVIIDDVQKRPTIKNLILGFQADTDRTLYAAWTCSGAHIASYSVEFQYLTRNNRWFIGSETSSKRTQVTYNAPSNALRVAVRVKPVSTTYQKNGATTSYFTGSWSKWVYYYFKENTTPAVPSVPTVSADGYKLTAELDCYDKNALAIRFEVVRDDTRIVHKAYVSVVKNHVSTTFTMTPGYNYKVRCQAISVDNTKITSAWSEYSNEVSSAAGEVRIPWIKARSAESVEVGLSTVRNAESFTVEYATDRTYFGRSSEVQSATVDNGYGSAIINGLETGRKWFFRAKATNSSGDSPWSAIKEILLGKPPAAPTTWSETTSAIIGQKLHLYWVHNSQDGSAETQAQVELTVNGNKTTQLVMNNSSSTSTDEDEVQTRHYEYNTASMYQGGEILWRVRTKGVMPDYGEWSAQRKVIVYIPPSFSNFGVRAIQNWRWDPFNFTQDTIYNSYDTVGTAIDTITSFPFYIQATVTPSSQNAISYSLTISANETYKSTDFDGKEVIIAAGTEVFSGFYAASSNDFLTLISAGDVRLEDEVSYKLTLKAAMDSGLTAEASVNVMVDFAEVEYEPDAEIGIDPTNFSANIQPYCVGDDGNLVDGIVLSVYRREADGSFTAIEEFVENYKETTVVDPHPSLDFARYRIVAMSKTTGAVSYYDLPGYPVNEPSIIIQWEEEYSSFDLIPDADSPADIDQLATPVQTGSMLRLPYNVDVQDSYSPDVSFANYIGREHPVSYYGTQKGVTSSWSTEIPADDKETIYALRRLASYMGDVYVREPSGTGYWAQVIVSFSLTHCAVTIPVSFDIKRVEGGI